MNPSLIVSVKVNGLWKLRFYVNFLIFLAIIFPEFMLPRVTLWRSAVHFVNNHLKFCVDAKEYPFNLEEC